MTPWISKCLLSLAVLQGVIPANQCVLKLAGLCNCGGGTTTFDSKERGTAPWHPACCGVCDAAQSPCQHQKSESRDNPCCAFTPAHGIAAAVPDAPSVDLHQDFAALAAFGPVEIISETLIPSNAVAASMPLHSTHIPLFLHVHSFLI